MLNINLYDKDLCDITLNGKKLKHIINTDLKQTIVDHLFQTYSIKMTCTNKYFTALDIQKDIDYLKNNRHLVYFNTNQRIWLILLITINEKPLCLLIDKQNSIFYILKCQFSPSLYNGTVFEGEVVDMYFLVSDFLVYKNKSIVNHSLERRLNLLRSIISTPNYVYDKFLDPLLIVMKDFIEYSELISFIDEYLPILQYKSKVSGLIFRPIENSNKNLIYNFNSKQRIPKLESEHTSSQMIERIDPQIHPEVKFLLFETGNPDDYCLKLLDQTGKLVEYDYALINDMKTSQYLQNTMDHIPLHTKQLGLCVLCRYNGNFKKWKPIKILENTKPNNTSEVL